MEHKQALISALAAYLRGNDSRVRVAGASEDAFYVLETRRPRTEQLARQLLEELKK